MRANWENKRNSYGKTRKVLNANKTIWEPKPKLAQHVATFYDFDNKIAQNARIADKQTEGNTADKKATRKAMAAVAVRVGKAVKSHGKATGDNALAEIGDVVVTDFTKGRDIDASDRATRILEAATPIQQDLVDGGLAPGEIQMLSEAIDAYKEELNAPRETTEEVKGANERLAKLFPKTDAHLRDILDPAIEALPEIHAEFKQAYRISRSIVDNPGGNGKPPALSPEPPTP